MSVNRWISGSYISVGLQFGIGVLSQEPLGFQPPPSPDTLVAVPVVGICGVVSVRIGILIGGAVGIVGIERIAATVLVVGGIGGHWGSGHIEAVPVPGDKLMAGGQWHASGNGGWNGSRNSRNHPSGGRCDAGLGQSCSQQEVAKEGQQYLRSLEVIRSSIKLVTTYKLHDLAFGLGWGITVVYPPTALAFIPTPH